MNTEISANPYEDIFSVKDKKIVITGANGHLGAEITKSLVFFGAQVLAISRQNNNLMDVIDKPNLHFVKGDCRNEEFMEESIDKFTLKHGGLSGLINNAYSAPKETKFDMPVSEIHEIFDSCFVHYWTNMRVAVKYFDASKSGSIINNGSLWGIVAPKLETYLDLKNEPPMAIVTAKAAVHQLTKYSSGILGSRGIRVNTLVPGFFPKKRGPERPDYIKSITDNLMIRRIGQPRDLLGGVLFLLSDASEYMTGQELVIDGGYTSH